jgi:tyrosine-protein kinase Etk/Wzc
MMFLKSNLMQNNQEVKALETKISIIQEKINEFKYSTKKNEISLSQMPEKAVEYMNLFRDVKVLNHILEFIIPQFENARLEEFKTSSDLQVIDLAIPEDYKAKPKRISIIFTIMFLYSIFLMLTLVIYNYYLEHKNTILKLKE